MKRIVTIVLTVALCAAMLVSCAAPAAAPSASESASASAAAPAGDAADTAEYQSWTKTNWEQASDADKAEVAELAFVGMGEMMLEGYTEKYEAAKNDENAKEQIAEGIKNMQTTIDQYFAAEPDGSIGDMIKQTKEIMDAADKLAE